MVDDKTISDQTHEFENIVYDMKLKGIVLPDIMLVAFMISKFPPSWTHFAQSLKHKHEGFTFDDLLVITLRINIIFLKNIYKNLILILIPILLRARVSLSLSPSRSMDLTKISLVEILLFLKIRTMLLITTISLRIKI